MHTSLGDAHGEVRAYYRWRKEMDTEPLSHRKGCQPSLAATHITLIV